MGTPPPRWGLRGFWRHPSGTYSSRRASGQPTLSLHTHPVVGRLAPSPDVKIWFMEDPTHGACFYFRPQFQATVAPCVSQPVDGAMPRVFSHIVLLWSFLLPPVGLAPHSCSKWELSLPSLRKQYDPYYQAIVDCREKEVLSTQPSSFCLGSSPKFSCRIAASGTLSKVGRLCCTPNPVQFCNSIWT